MRGASHLTFPAWYRSFASVRLSALLVYLAALHSSQLCLTCDAMEAPEAAHLPLPPQHQGCMSRSGASHSQLLLHLYSDVMLGSGLVSSSRASKIDVV